MWVEVAPAAGWVPQPDRAPGEDMRENLAELKESSSNEMRSEDLVLFHDALRDLGAEIWVDGGWGVDALLGRQTRRHKDLDIAIQEKDVPKAREFLEARGYR